MARGRPAVLAALCLLISVVALHVKARQLPDCGPLGKHRYRCGGPPRITRSVQANPEQLSQTDIHEASSIQGDDSTHAPPASSHELKKAIATSSTSGAANTGVAGESTSIAEDPECGPMEKNRFRCENPPRIRVRDIYVLA